VITLGQFQTDNINRINHDYIEWQPLYTEAFCNATTVEAALKDHFGTETNRFQYPIDNNKQMNFKVH